MILVDTSGLLSALDESQRHHRECAALLHEVARGAYQLEPFDAADIARAKEIVDRYADLAIGLADASIVVLAERHSVNTVLSLDQRHFRAMRIERRKRFNILPFDS